MLYPASAILAISSYDRYVKGQPRGASYVAPPQGSGSTAPVPPPTPDPRTDNALTSLFDGSGQPGNNFTLVSPGSFIYGYISRIAVSQIQLEYKIPTVVASNQVFTAQPFYNNPLLIKRIGNNILPILFGTSETDPGILYYVQMPYGFYTPQELAAMLTVYFDAAFAGILDQMVVRYSNAGQGNNPLDPGQTAPGANPTGYGNSFTFTTTGGPDPQFFGFPNLDYMRGIDPITGKPRFTEDQILATLKCYRLLGISYTLSSDGTPTSRVKLRNFVQTGSPSFLYTPFIDICSARLTKFQKVKDTDTSAIARTSLVSRVYLSGVGNPQATNLDYALGSEPFVMTADLNTPKVIRWNKDEALNSMDFQLFDYYGDRIYWTWENNTEFQMTLVCQEDEDY